MKVATALLCDFAQVRENLLFMASGGVTRLWRHEFPATMNVDLALAFELYGHERETPHELRVEIMSADSVVGGLHAAFQIGSESPWAVGESALVPLVIDMHDVPIPDEGAYRVDVYVDETHQTELSFRAVLRATGEQGPDPSS